MGFYEQAGRVYNRIAEKFFHMYKVNILISTMFLILIVAFLGYKYYTTGDIIQRGVDFKGGYQYVVKYPENASFKQIYSYLESQYPGINVRNIQSQNTIYIEYTQEIPQETLDKLNLKIESKRVIQSSLSATFWVTAIKLLISAYLIVTIIVFIIFRSFVPSIAVILAGISDILFAIVMMNILHIPLTMGTLSSLLILMGYSIDTDILLTTRTLKEKPKNIVDAMIHSSKTGLTMTFTSIVAMISLIIFSTSVTLDNIATVILSGLVADIIFTWFQNASILRIYIERRVNRK